MAESTHAQGQPELRIEAARALGYDRTYADNSSDEQDDIDRLVHAAERRFLWPHPVPWGNDPNYVHRWSFYQVVYGTLQTSDGTYQYDCPDDFGAFIGNYITIDDDGENYSPVARRPEPWIRHCRQQNNETESIAKYFAVQVKAFDGTTSNRFRLVFWPTWDGAYGLTFPYRPIADAITSDAPYVWGTAEHAQTLIAAVWAEWERLYQQESGVHAAHFQTCLLASIGADLANVPSVLGIMRDASDDDRLASRHNTEYTVQYGGQP